MEKIVICLCFVVYMAYTIFLIIMKPDPLKKIPIGLEITNLCFRSFKFIADIYMMFLFLYLLNFILSIRKKGPDGSLTLKNKLVISFILFLWLLTFIQAL